MEKAFTHVSLFSGIGGLDLAAEAAGFVTVAQVEKADFPFSVLEKRFPKVERWRDIAEFTAIDFWRRTGCSSVDVLSGGFPCQPHSLAGKRLASLDERDLWGEMRRVICEIAPEWVVCENVRGLLFSEHGQFFAGILRDFSDMGYDVGWGMLSAAAVGAVHRRERMAIVAHANNSLTEGVRCNKCKEIFGDRDFLSSFGKEIGFYSSKLPVFSPMVHTGDDEFIKPLISRKDDGFSSAMDRNKALGNAVCPQVFLPVFAAIHKILEVTHDRARI